TCFMLSQPTGTGLTGGSGTGLTGGGQGCTTVACCDDLCTKQQALTQACPNDSNCEGCSTVTHFAWPECAQIAELSGHAIVVSSNLVGGSVLNPPDDDFGIDVCPLTDPKDDTMTLRWDPSMRRDPFDGFTEIRGTGSFTQGHGNAEVGRVHVEAQDCRIY